MIQIIYLNGPSSSGKTTLAKALQEVLEPPFLHIGIDKIIGMMPKKLNNWLETPNISVPGFSWKPAKDAIRQPIQELQMGPYAKKLMQTYQEIVVLFATQGYSLIIDDVAIKGASEVSLWKEKLQKIKTLYVGLYADLEVLEQRERERADRIMGSARAQYFSVHQGVHYDLEIHSSTSTVEESANQILEKINFFEH